MKPEPPFAHGSLPKTGILLCNLGTPAAPTAAALRPYLAQFLSDPRVVELPRLLWWPILHGIILRIRPKKSAAKYASIWMPEGSPLKVWTERQAALLKGYLGERGHQVQVQWAMRYGKPSVASGLDSLKAAGCTRILVLPAYPQYSAATTASVADAVFTWGLRVRNLPELRLVRNYAAEPEYIAALAESVKHRWQNEGRPDVLLMSYHGMPARTLHRGGDPYHCECHLTSRLLAEALELNESQYRVAFQSRFGREPWLQPYTEPSLIEMARSGVKRVDVICPGFACDCIETLEEIALEAKEAFIEAGGEQFRYIECLNGSPSGIRALVSVCEQHLAGWPTRSPSDTARSEVSRARALALGAKN